MSDELTAGTSKRTIRVPTVGQIDITVIAPNDATPTEIARMCGELIWDRIVHSTQYANPCHALARDVGLDSEAIGPEFTREQLDELRTK